MAIPTKDYLEAPYTDDNMIYDKVESRYIATHDMVVKNGYINLLRALKTPEGVQSYLDLVSTAVYTYILSHYDNKYRYAVLWYMAHSKQIRNALMQIYISSVWYNHRDGGFLVVYQSGINLDQMKDIKMDITKAFSPIERQIIDNSFLGTRILETNFNVINKYSTITLLKEAMVTQGIITQEEADACDSSSELLAIPKVRARYRIYLNEDYDYCLEDTRFYENVILATKYEFDSVVGTW